MVKNILPTDNGKVFSITLDPGYCFAMCIDMAKTLLAFQKQRRPKRLPTKNDLHPEKWAILQSAYEINSSLSDKIAIEGQGLEVVSSIDPTPFTSFANVASSVTSIIGTTVFGIMGNGGHELMWHRDDVNNIWLYLDPNGGLYQFMQLSEAANYIANDLNDYYSDLNQKYDYFTLKLS